AVRELDALEREVGRAGKPLEPRLLQCRVVVRVQVVEADDAFAAREQRLGDVVADETGGAGDEDHAAPAAPLLPRPMPKYCRPARRTTAGSYRLRPSNSARAFSVDASHAKSGLRNSSHSVITASASAPSTAARA